MSAADPSDAELDRLYREAGGMEPPPELDAAILQRARTAAVDPTRASEATAAATVAAAQKRKSVADEVPSKRPAPPSELWPFREPRSWLLRWRVPLAVAATMLISGTVTLMLEDAGVPALRGRPTAGSDAYETPLHSARQNAHEVQPALAPSADEAQRRVAPDHEATLADPQPPQTAAELSQAPTRIATDGTSVREAPPDAARPSPAPPRERESPPSESAKSRAQERRADADSQSRASATPPRTSDGERYAQSGRAATPSPPASAAGAERSSASSASVAPSSSPPTGQLEPLRERTARPAASASPSRTASDLRDHEPLPTHAPSPSAAAERPSPEVMIERIRALRREGREDEARKLLRELVEQHPDFKLPDDLRSAR